MRAVVVRGEDRILVLRVQFEESREPYDMTDVTLITVQFKKSDNSILALTSELTGGVAATGTHEGVTFTADEEGTAGNAIELVFNGVDDIDTVVDAWNTANPGNPVSHDGTGTDVLGATTLQLSGGLDATAPVNILDAKLGKVQVDLTETETNSLRLGPDQSFKALVDKGDHPGGERRIVVFRNALEVIDSVI